MDSVRLPTSCPKGSSSEQVSVPDALPEERPGGTRGLGGHICLCSSLSCLGQFVLSASRPWASLLWCHPEVGPERTNFSSDAVIALFA